ncbi:MAG: OFA family MFS transporter [Candidatus Velthaea sp.]
MKRWIVAAAGLVCVLGPGALYSFSLLSTPLTAAFGWSSTDVTWAFALANLCLALGGVVGGIFSDRFGPRYIAAIGIALWAAGYGLCATLPQSHSLIALYAFYGVMGGVGCGMAYISALSAVIKWFPNARGFGGGLVIMGFGFGSFVYNTIVKPTAAYLTITTDTQAYVSAQASAVAQHLPFEPAKYVMEPASITAFMSIFTASGVAFAVIGIAAAWFLEVPPTSDPVYIPSGKQFTVGAMVSDARFYVIWAMLFLNIFGGITIISNVVPLMHDITGITTAGAAGLYGLLALFNGIGRLAWGWLSDRISRRVTFAILFAGQSLAFFVLDSTKDLTVVAIAIGILLLCYGGGFGVMPAFNADYFGTKHFGTNYGVQLSAWGLAAVAGTYFISVMKTVSGSYIGLMQPVSIALLVAMFFPLIIESSKRNSAPKQADSAPVPA